MACSPSRPSARNPRLQRTGLRLPLSRKPVGQTACAPGDRDGVPEGWG